MKCKAQSKCNQSAIKVKVKVQSKCLLGGALGGGSCGPLVLPGLRTDSLEQAGPPLELTSEALDPLQQSGAQC